MGFKRSRVQISSPRLPQTPTASQDAVGECTRLRPARIPKRLCTRLVHALRDESRLLLRRRTPVAMVRDMIFISYRATECKDLAAWVYTELARRYGARA